MSRPHGLVLAGGAGSRMGADKAGLVVGGVPLAHRAATSLARVCGRVFASLRPGQERQWLGALPDVTAIEDTAADLGPVAGVLAAFARSPAAAWLVLAVDMPFVTAAMLGSLVAGRGPRWDAVAFRSDALGGADPLCALYEPAAGAEIARRAASGERSLRWMLASMRVRLLDPPHPSALASVNTPQDLAQALDQPPPGVV
jgi:molybdopterin-guanine dinucleotide biosynthesis protein A